MKKILWLLPLILLGCNNEIDPRVRQSVSVLRHRTQVTANKFMMAETPEQKIWIAEKYFNRTTKFLSALDEYINYGETKTVGSKPKDIRAEVVE
jgi:hypothetical protein